MATIMKLQPPTGTRYYAIWAQEMNNELKGVIAKVKNNQACATCILRDKRQRAFGITNKMNAIMVYDFLPYQRRSVIEIDVPTYKARGRGFCWHNIIQFNKDLIL